ncbi:MAG: tetratricopeptide repeat protein [Thermoguttaceae bacterium]
MALSTEIQVEAEKGDPKAQWCLGLCLKRGDGVDIDEGEAAEWFQKAKDQGFIPLRNDLLDLRSLRVNSDQDKVERASRCRRSAEDGFAPVQWHMDRCFLLGDRYFKGEGADQDREGGLRLFQKAAEQGYDKAKYSW